MIAATKANIVSPHVAKRARKMKVRTLSAFSYQVTPPEKDKPIRVVHFGYHDDSGVVSIDCFDKTTGESCKANAFNLLCAHAEAAIRRLLANSKRKLNLQSNGTKRNRAIQKYARKVVSETREPDLPGVVR